MSCLDPGDVGAARRGMRQGREYVEQFVLTDKRLGLSASCRSTVAPSMRQRSRPRSYAAQSMHLRRIVLQARQRL